MVQAIEVLENEQVPGLVYLEEAEIFTRWCEAATQ